MADQQQREQDAQVLSFPRASADGAEQPVLEGEVVDEATDAQTEQTTQAQSETTATSSSGPSVAAGGPRAVASTVAPSRARPLSVAQAGSKYAYITSLAAAGARRLPTAISDKVLDRVYLSHLREGGTHRGEILPAQRATYEQVVAARRDRRRRAGKALLVRKTRISRHGLTSASVRETHRPRWETVVPAAGEVVNAVYPHTPLVSPVIDTINAGVADFVSGLAGVVGEGVATAASSPSAVFTALGLVGASVAWQARAEHHDRQQQLLALMSADGNGDLMPDEPADVITAAFRAAGILRAPTSTRPGQRVQLQAPIADDGESWTARIAVAEGVTTAVVRDKLAKLASALDRSLPQIAVMDGASERRMTLRVWHGDALPFTGEPVPSPLAQALSTRLDQGVRVGLDADGQPVLLNLGKGRHGLVVSSSGNGKTVLLQIVAAATVLDPNAQLTLLDGKPDGAYAGLKPVCWKYATTAESACEERGADALEAVADDMDERLARAERGEDIGGDHVVILDEFQEWTGSANGGGQKVGDPKFRMRAALERIARRGRSARVRLVLASQQYDGRTLDDAVLANIGWRAIGYAPKKMSKDALGDLAERYGLDTSISFVDEVQAGASLIAGGGVHPYRAQRADMLTNADLTAIADRVAQRQANTSEHEDRGDSGQQGDVEPLTAAEAQLLAALVIYGEADAEWITAAELYREVVDGELGWEVNQTTRTTVGTALRKAGVDKRVNQEAVDGRRTSVTRYRRTDLVAVATSLGAAA